MPVIENRCPHCGSSSSADAHVPDNGTLFNCGRCGFLGIWEDHYWRTPTEVERTELLGVPEVSDTLFLSMVGDMCQRADNERIIRILTQRLTVAIRNYELSCGMAEKLLRDIAEDLRTAGFHTHRRPIELEESE
jgi:ribosomal protein S27AE